MSRLIDILRARIPTDAQFRLDKRYSLVQNIEGCEVIVADNCAQYYFGSRDSIKTWNIKDFPNIAPVFSNFFVEWIMPKSQTQSNARLLIGCHFISEKESDGWTYTIGTISSWRNITETRMVMRCSVDCNGRAVSFWDVVLSKRLAGWLDAKTDFSHDEKLSSLFANDIFPAYLTLSFMHCKNVLIKTETPSRALSHQYERKHGRPLVSYKVLEIEPMKRILEHEGGASKTGLRQALHICRGHFKDYTEHGLFGKYKGMYWWDSHVRGSIDQGVVTKDYSVGNIDASAIMH